MGTLPERADAEVRDCGSADAVVAEDTWGPFPYSGMPSIFYAGSNATYSLGTPMTGNPDLLYKVCWAHSPGSLEDFVVEVEFRGTLAAPLSGNLECVLGQPCSLTMFGTDFTGLAPTSSFMIFTTGSHAS